MFRSKPEEGANVCRTLTKPEQNYSQIEVESLAAVGDNVVTRNVRHQRQMKGDCHQLDNHT